MQKKYPKIIFFIKGSVPKPEDAEAAEKLGFNVVFRNALFVDDGGAPEACDGVAGAIPAKYADFPKAEDALASFFEARAKSEILPTKAPLPSDGTKVQAEAKKPANAAASASGKANKKPVVWESNKPVEKEE